MINFVTPQEANNIPGIGKALADKVWEIARTGHLRKIDHLCKGEEMEALNLFNNIWGVGPTVAQEWVTQVCIGIGQYIQEFYLFNVIIWGKYAHPTFDTIYNTRVKSFLSENHL